MTNMSYCRFENTLHDLIDCHDELERMESGDEFTEIASHNTRERECRVKFIQQVLETADLLRGAMGIEADDIGDVSKETIVEWITKCEERDAELRRNHEEE